jgi:hypothetical protein
MRKAGGPGGLAQELGSTRSARAVRAAACVVLAVISSSILAGSAQAADSSWSVVASPDKGTGSNVLQDVSCVTPTDCAAVGYFTQKSGTSETLIERWNGRSWSVMPSANVGVNGDVLRALSCISTSCVAVGDYGASSGAVQALAESWSGRGKVTSLATPDPSATFDDLSAISCSSSSRCVAVGDYGTSNIKYTLVESWNGKKWSLEGSPNVGTKGSYLTGVSCSSAKDCVAVGTYQTTAGNSRALIETWNGTAWSVSGAPNATDDSLSSVSCSGPKRCMAVGNSFKNGRAGPFAETWNGKSWSIVNVPGFNSTVVYLDGVSCATSTSCIAAGSSGHPVIETWNGTKWSKETSPNKGNGGSLVAVSCITLTKCVAAGTYDLDTESSGFVTKTLIESG